MAFNHAALPFLGKAKPLAQITTSAEARAYAAGGYHVCVDQNAKAGAGTSRANAWQAAGGAYARAYLASAGAIAIASLGPAIALLRSADAAATAAASLTPAASNGSGAGAKGGGGGGPVVVNPADPTPPAEQIQQQTGGQGFMDMNVSGIPIWALALPLAYLAWQKFGKKGGGRRRRR